MRSPSAGLFYIFCDEKYLSLEGKRQILTSYVALPQGAWKSLRYTYQRLAEPKRMSRLDRIEAVLEQTDGGAVVARIELPQEMLPKGERDGTIDLPDMSRADNAWGAALAFGLTAVFPLLHNLGLQVQTADVYFDNRELKREHIIKMKELVTTAIPKVIRAASRVTHTIPEDRPNIRRFQGISKPPAGREPDQFQAGLSLAHHVLQNWRLIGSRPGRRILVRDNTNQLVNYIRKFQV